MNGGPSVYGISVGNSHRGNSVVRHGNTRSGVHSHSLLECSV